MGRKVKFKSDKHRRAVFAAIAAKKKGDARSKAKESRKNAYGTLKYAKQMVKSGRNLGRNGNDAVIDAKSRIKSYNTTIQKTKVKRKKAS